MRSTKASVERALSRLQEAALALGLRNRYEVEYGSKINGVQHVLLDFDPAFKHAHREKIGDAYQTVELFLTGMIYALVSAKRELDRQEDVLRRQRIVQGGGRDASGFPRGMVS